jgi:hypothetical protein
MIRLQGGKYERTETAGNLFHLWQSQTGRQMFSLQPDQQLLFDCPSRS